MRADFVQIASNGEKVEGRLYIEKPNKIRMEYNAPSNVLIVGNGDYIVYYDKELDQITNIDYEDIPAAAILANTVKIDGKELKVTNFMKIRALCASGCSTQMPEIWGRLRWCLPTIRLSFGSGKS